MPVTPLHLAGTWAFWLATGRRGSFVAASLGSVLIDLEVPIYFVLSGLDTGSNPHHARGVMHSLLGVFTLNVLVVAAVYRYGMPRFWRWCERRWPERRVYTFAGVDVRTDPPGPAAFYLSAAAGGLSHLWLDLPTHSFNPILWPFTSDPLNLLPWSESPPWEIAFNLTILALLVAMLRMSWGAWRPGERPGGAS